MPCRTLARLALVSCFSLLAGVPAHAQLFRAYLALAGSDANPCTVSLPCRLLPAALAAVANGGEIWMLDSANYNTGAVNIAKSVTVMAVPGAVGSVVATNSANAINIATAGVKVTLRNLVIVPVAGATGLFHGIHMSAAASLVVDRCIVANMSNNGVYVTAPGNIRVVDSTVRGNGGTGIWVSGTAGSTTSLDIAGVTLDGNASQGVVASSDDATATVKVGMRDSRVLQTGNHGALGQSTAGGTVLFNASNNTFSNNGNTGLGAFGAGVKVWASGNTSTGNYYGFQNSSGLFETPADNNVRNNTNNIVGTITYVPPV